MEERKKTDVTHSALGILKTSNSFIQNVHNNIFTDIVLKYQSSISSTLPTNIYSPVHIFKSSSSHVKLAQQTFRTHLLLLKDQ